MPQPPRRRGARTALRCAEGLLGVAALMALATGCAGQVSGAWSSDNIPPANLTERRAQLIADDRRCVYVCKRAGMLAPACVSAPSLTRTHFIHA